MHDRATHCTLAHRSACKRYHVYILSTGCRGILFLRRFHGRHYLCPAKGNKALFWIVKIPSLESFFFLLENTRGNKMFLKPWHIESFLNKWRVFLICNTVFNSQRRRGDLGWSWFKNLARWLVVVWFGRCLGQARGLCSNPGCDHHCFSATRYSTQCGSFHPMHKGKPTLAKER